MATEMVNGTDVEAQAEVQHEAQEKASGPPSSIDDRLKQEENQPTPSEQSQEQNETTVDIPSRQIHGIRASLSKYR